MKKKIIKKKSVKSKVRRATASFFHSWELVGNQSKTSTILSQDEINLLEMRKEAIAQEIAARQKRATIEAAIITGCNNILGIQDTPQGTQFVKKVHGKQLLRFHYV